MSRERCVEIGVISDTHSLLRPAALEALAGVVHIVHAGDVGEPGVLDALALIAPLTAVRGNNDRGPWAERLPLNTTVEIAGVRLLVLHNRGDLVRADPRAQGVHAVVSGHSHRPAVERVGDVLYVNPGSAGPRRFTLPITVARLELGPGCVTGRIIELTVAP